MEMCFYCKVAGACDGASRGGLTGRLLAAIKRMADNVIPEQEVDYRGFYSYPPTQAELQAMDQLCFLARSRVKRSDVVVL